MDGSADLQRATDSSYPAAMRRHGFMLTFCVAILLAAVSLRVDGETRVALPGDMGTLPALCLWQRFLGVSCPGCGLTRSVTSFAQGDFLRSWSFHAAGASVFAWLLLQIPYHGANLWRLLRRREPFATRWMTAANWTVLLSIFLFWAGRRLAS